MKIVFITGPITSGGQGSVAANQALHERLQRTLAELGIASYCAASHTHWRVHSSVSGGFLHEWHTEFLCRAADAVAALPGWEESKGASADVACARELNLPPFYPHDPSDVKEIVEWAGEQVE